ncbi:MAG: deoxyribose-phosphate aldolase [Verrucomicrobia bacterium]|nr:deoxyribose-phosphate aldolase [Verrucomicrobiota bacterium]MBI3871207.1 deoxyribose-phosphate aldolase [Verrucomicrobiota bacterium]
MQTPTASELAAYIEHTLLKPEALGRDIDRLCEEAMAHHFFGVCVHGSRVSRAYSRLEETDVKVVAVVGFPAGACESDVKRYETEVAIDGGASEIDMVLNTGQFKDGDHGLTLRELRDVVEAADERPVKLILETCLLSDEEIVKACQLAEEAGARFVKTSTGFGSAGAKREHVALMRKTVGDELGVKASGGIRDLAAALAMIEAGANRIGTSAGVQLMRELSQHAR